MMKRILIALAALGIAGLTGVGTVASAQNGNNGTQTAVQRNTQTFAIENMTCALCPITVRKAINSVAGVQSVKVDFKTKRAVVTFNSAATTAGAIAQASTEAGYPAKLVNKGP